MFARYPFCNRTVMLAGAAVLALTGAIVAAVLLCSAGRQPTVATRPPPAGRRPAPSFASGIHDPGAALLTASERPPWSEAAHTQQTLCAELRESVVEISVEDAEPLAHLADKPDTRLTKLAELLEWKTVDELVKHPLCNDPALVGLPWQQGEACVLAHNEAHNQGIVSPAARQALEEASKAFRKRRSDAERRPGAEPQPEPAPEDVETDRRVFWSQVHNATEQTGAAGPPGLATLYQMVQVENKFLRLSLINYAEAIRGANASTILARMAVFDPNPYVRSRAARALTPRPVNEYLDTLLAGLRHPWQPAAEHAAEALVTLRLGAAIPRLVEVLAEPDPGAAFLHLNGSEEVLVKREMIRVNHLRNCLLCHTTSVSTADFIRAAHPIPGQSLTLATYYRKSDLIAVRPDVIYLRQDFSVIQRVDNPGQWPAYQRYDYLVRVRPLTVAELTAMGNAPPLQPSGHKQAVLYALRVLTGRDVGTSVEAWRQVLEARSATSKPGAPNRLQSGS